MTQKTGRTSEVCDLYPVSEEEVGKKGEEEWGGNFDRDRWIFLVYSYTSKREVEIHWALVLKDA